MSNRATPEAPVGHPLRFTVIAHGDRSVLGPISGERLDGLVARTPLERGDHVLELGCGKGDLIARLLSRWPEATAEGFDRNPWFLAAARAAAERAGVASRVSFIETEGAEWRRDAFGVAGTVFSSQSLVFSSHSNQQLTTDN